MRLVWMVVLAACSSNPTATSSPAPSSVPSSGSAPAGSTAELPAEWLTCGADDDCEAVEMGCCDHCNGGWVLGVNKASVEAARAKYHDTCEANTACTERGCGGVKGTCRDGACTWAWDRQMDGEYVPQPNTIKGS